MKLDEEDGNFPCFGGEDFDDYGYGVNHPVSIGDEIYVERDEEPQWGIVVGIIRNVYGDPVCYKVVRTKNDRDTVGVFDYIQAREVSFCEPCETAAWSLSRIGYEFIENEEESDDDEEDSVWRYMFRNDTTKDVIFW